MRMRRWAIAIAVCLTACTDTSPHSAGIDQGWSGPGELDRIAYATAIGLASSEARADILEAMRASVKVQHSLLLGEYLASVAGQRLLRDGAIALGVPEAEFHRRVLASPTLEVVVPIREHRMTWTGTARIGVAASWDADEFDFTVYDQFGADRRAGDLPALMSYDAFFVVRPQENFGTRIGRQADVPGPVIQDAGDGERAMIVSMQMAGEQPRSVDFGQYGTEQELQAALVEAFGSADGPSVEDVAADGGLGCVDIHCGDSTRGDGGAIGGWSEHPTYLRHWSGRCSLIGEGAWDSAEVEVWLKIELEDGGHQGFHRKEGLECPEEAHWVGESWEEHPGKKLAGFSKIPKGHPVLFQIIETDAFFDDLLGEALVAPNNNKNRHGYDPEDDAFVWWDFDLELPHLIAEISW